MLAVATAPANIAAIQTALPFAAAVPDIAQAVHRAYDTVRGTDAEMSIANINMLAARALRDWHAAAVASARARERLDAATNSLCDRPATASAKGTRLAQPGLSSGPRAAHNNLNTRTTVAPFSSRTLTPQQLKQMRGVGGEAASDALVRSILG